MENVPRIGIWIPVVSIEHAAEMQVAIYEKCDKVSVVMRISSMADNISVYNFEGSAPRGDASSMGYEDAMIRNSRGD
jgi:hypothetical protein